MYSVLLTRSIKENQKLENHLKQYEFDCQHCSLISYEDLPISPAVFQGYTELIITSKYAASKISKMNPGPLDAWVVGKTSADILRRAGMNIRYVAQNAQDLIDHISSKSCNKAVYISADQVTTPMPLEVKRVIIYKVIYRNELDFNELMAMKRLNYILLYSQNCARVLIKLLFKYNLLGLGERVTIISISSKVAQEVNDYFKNIIFCNKGEHNRMIELLINHARIRRKIQ